MNDSIRSEGLLPLTVTVSRPRPGVRLLRIAGELDIATAPLLAEHLYQRPGSGSGSSGSGSAGPEVLVLDLSEVTLLAASGVALIVDARRVDRVNGRLHVVGVTGNRPVARVLDLTGVRGLLEVHDDLSGLLADLDRH